MVAFAGETLGLATRESPGGEPKKTRGREALELPDPAPPRQTRQTANGEPRWLD